MFTCNNAVFCYIITVGTLYTCSMCEKICGTVRFKVIDEFVQKNSKTRNDGNSLFFTATSNSHNLIKKM